MRSIKNFFRNNLGYILLSFIIWRLVLIISAFIAPFLVPKWGGRFPYVEEQLINTKLPYWIWVWGNFDGVHYLTIAKSSYLAYFTQTFFPLYPLLIRFIGNILLGNFLIGGLIISNLSFLIALYFLNKLLLLENYSKNIRWILIFLIFSPTSFYFGSLYTEGLFFLLIILTFYFYKINKLFLASVCGAFATATRLFGILLLPSLLVDYYLSKKKTKKSSVLFLFLIPLGLLMYMYYLQIKFNDPLLFWHAQPAFGAERLGSSIIFPPQVIYRYSKILLSVSVANSGFWVALFELLSLIYAFILLLIGFFKKIRISYLLFASLSILLPTLTGTLSSMPRYIVIAFPIFISLGLIKNRLLKITILFIHFVILIISVIFFTRGYWIS